MRNDWPCGQLKRDQGPQRPVATATHYAGERWRALEDRSLLSTIVVNNPTDTPVGGKIDLRQAIAQANTNGGAETIAFDGTVFATQMTITLTRGSGSS